MLGTGICKLTNVVPTSSLPFPSYLVPIGQNGTVPVSFMFVCV